MEVLTDSFRYIYYTASLKLIHGEEKVSELTSAPSISEPQAGPNVEKSIIPNTLFIGDAIHFAFFPKP